MRKYRSRPPLQAKRLRSDDAWFEDFNHMEKNITVFEQESGWENTGLLGPDGEPIQCLVMGLHHPIGFVNFEDVEEEDE